MKVISCEYANNLDITSKATSLFQFVMSTLGRLTCRHVVSARVREQGSVGEWIAARNDWIDFELLFAIVVFGLSVDISKEICQYGPCDQANGSTTGYTAWAGGFGIIASIIGLVSLFWDSIKPMITLVMDGFAALFFLAGGIAMAGQLRGFNCANLDRWVWAGGDYRLNALKRLCTQNTADSVFCFLSFLVCAALVAYGFIKRKD
ncbi:hypothetical protein FKW77_000523 [Venturia effusa]|uniref:MARVEL domain-containing protein n=1 Tax=Venturia effusa TaxID=50376 RepID=A0A517L8G7_9PEZI|nr:hypothetical protein FKW77_000523 [Venturia effusa]